MTQAQFINAGIVVPIRLTHKQQRYAARCIGIETVTATTGWSPRIR